MKPAVDRRNRNRRDAAGHSFRSRHVTRPLWIRMSRRSRRPLSNSTRQSSNANCARCRNGHCRQILRLRHRKRQGGRSSLHPLRRHRSVTDNSHRRRVLLPRGRLTKRPSLAPPSSCSMKPVADRDARSPPSRCLLPHRHALQPLRNRVIRSTWSNSTPPARDRCSHGRTCRRLRAWRRHRLSLMRHGPSRRELRSRAQSCTKRRAAGNRCRTNDIRCRA